MELIELFIDEVNLKDGVNAISLVLEPATEENFVALKKHDIQFKAIDEEKRILIGLILVADREIYRKQGDYEFKITFSKDTVRKAAELYLKRLKNNNTTLDHVTQAEGVSLIESWTVEDPKMDKTALHKLNAQEGDWAGILKVDSDAIWQDVKAGKYMGFSIEGFFSDQIKMAIQEKDSNKVLNQIKEILKNG